MKQIAVLITAMLCALTSSAIYRVSILSHEELCIGPEEILQLPGIGLGIANGPDSIMLLDNPSLAFIRWTEPNNARSIVGCGESFYATEGDSIYRIATDSIPRKFIGRLDNEQFKLSAATDSTFYAITADEDFSCVYEINPETGYCDPLISIESALLKIAPMGDILLLWADDAVMIAKDDGMIEPFYSAPDIIDVELSPIGIFIATDKSVLWFTDVDECIKLLPVGVTNLWWDNEDLLYYRTKDGDIIAIVGLEAFYKNETNEKSNS